MWIHQVVCGAAGGGLVMENTWVVLRLKQVLVMVHLSCAWVCSCAALGTWDASWFPKLSLNPVVSGASCSALAPWSWWQGWQRAADGPAWSRAGRSFSPVQAHGITDGSHPCKLCTDSTCASPKPVPALCALPHVPAGEMWRRKC